MANFCFICVKDVKTYVGLNKIMPRVKRKIKKINLLINFNELLVEFLSLTFSVLKWVGKKC